MAQEGCFPAFFVAKRVGIAERIGKLQEFAGVLFPAEWGQRILVSDQMMSNLMAESAGFGRRLGQGRSGRLRPALWMVGGVLLLLLLVVAGFLLWLRGATMAALPKLDGEERIGGAGNPAAGLTAAVTVRRDGHGVPTIEATSEGDLFLAQGYVTAQDRLWQMDLLRRASQGELAEILGHSMLKHDREQRVLGFRSTAERVYGAMPAADRERLDEYARGVNLFIAGHGSALPPEFRVLCYKPRPWTGVDSISIGLLIVQMLDTHWDAKLGRAHVAAKLANPKLEAELYPVGSWRDHPPTGQPTVVTHPAPAKSSVFENPDAEDEDDDPLEDDRSIARNGAEPLPMRGVFAAIPAKLQGAIATAMDRILAPQLAALPGMGREQCRGCRYGSNNWVVAGSRTASGRPLLADDMHLDLTAPNIWYMVGLSAPGYHVAGVSFPGMPFVIAGHNEHVAWGFTALFADVQDLYVEQLDGRGNYKSADGRWLPLTTRRELIHVRGRPDVVVNVEATGHGPILNPILNHESRTIALRWTLYDPALNVFPLYQLNKAADWPEFEAALGTWNWPTQNLVYSDDQGHIAYHAIGRVPERPAGLAGVPIADNQHEWKGYIPFHELPQSFDPPSGFLATANSRVTWGQQKPIALEYADPYRAERIYKRLDGRGGLTPAEMLATQTDIYSEVDQEIGHRLAYAIEHTPGTDARLRKAAVLMRNWDGRLSEDAAAPSIIDHARDALWPLILNPKLGKVADDYQWSERDFAEEEILMHGGTDWLPPGFRNWDALLTEAVRRGLDEGHAPADLARWNFGSWHTISVEHPVASKLPLLGWLTGSGEHPLTGNGTTVKQVYHSFGPSQRFVMDWSNVDGSTENIVMGESGNPLSAYYRDQWKDWYSGTSFALAFTPQAVARASHHTLRLVP